jgi:hypothetical protein
VVSVKTMFNEEPNITRKDNRINRAVTDDNILRKDGSILTLYELKPIGEKQLLDEAPRRPQWTSALMIFQCLQLKMAYKSKTKLRARIMKQIRMKVNQAHNS